MQLGLDTLIQHNFEQREKAYAHQSYTHVRTCVVYARVICVHYLEYKWRGGRWNSVEALETDVAFEYCKGNFLSVYYV